MQLLVCNSRFTPEQNCNVTELTEITWKAIFFAVFIEHGQRRIISFIVRLLRIKLGFFPDYSGRFDAQRCPSIYEVCSRTSWREFQKTLTFVNQAFRWYIAEIF